KAELPAHNWSSPTSIADTRPIGNGDQEQPDPMNQPDLFGETPQKASSSKRSAAAGVSKANTWLPPDRSLDAIREDIGECTRCRLHEMRRNIVFGEGNPKAELMIVGEGPGADEDASGRPFVGRAGQLLNKIIAAMGFRREDVYIANIVKC